MSTAKLAYAAPATYGVASSLTAGSYDMIGPAYANTNGAIDTRFEYAASVAASPSGPIQLFVVGSTDGTTWPALPTSATDTSHDTSMRLLGNIFCNGGGSSETVRDAFSIATAFPGGIVPPYWRVIVKNGSGVALSTCSAKTQEVSLPVA